MTGTSPKTAPPSRSASILSPIVDILCVGGLSLIAFVPLLLSGRSDLVLVGAGAQAWIATVINMPHFMASYRIVYRSREMMMRHKWASIYVPAILVAYIVLALWEAQTSKALVIVLITVSSAYLAWHYTGQVWGMMASYAYLDGMAFDGTERFLIRTSLRILLVWHLAWFLFTQIQKSWWWLEPAYLFVSAATVVALVLGLIGLVKMWRRTGRLPPARALVAWFAIFVWYAMMARDPKAIFWIQIAHALQYLAFPIRVELNRTTAAPHTPGRVAAHMALYGAGLLVLSILITQVVPGTAMSVVGDVFGEQPGQVAPILILMFINIHHYFTDGVIWKISNPEVRKELFAHVPRVAAKAPVKAEPTVPDATRRPRGKKAQR
jgi:hypothetical protein